MALRRLVLGALLALLHACSDGESSPEGGSGGTQNTAGTGAAGVAGPPGPGAGGTNAAGTTAAGTGAAGTNAAGTTAAGAGAAGTNAAGTTAAGTTAAGAGGTAPAPLGPGDKWVSYANGPRSWFANLDETSLDATSAQGLALLWKLDAEVTAPPVVLGDRLWVTTGEQGLYALNARDGSVIWHDETVSSFSAPAYDERENVIYVNRWEGGVMHAFDADDGNLRWSIPISDQEAVRGWSSPVVAGDLLVVGIASSDRGLTFKGGISAFDLVAGTRAWTYTHTEEQAAGVSIWGGPSVDVDAQVVFGGSGNNYTMAGAHSDSLFAVDLGAQELLWNQQMATNDNWAYDCILCGPDHDFGTNPIVLEHAGRELLAAGQKSGSFWLVDRVTGEVLWERQVSSTSHPAYGGVLNNGAFDGTRILVAGNEGAAAGTLFALNPDPNAGGEVFWERPLSGLVLAPITVAGELAFVPVGETMEVVQCATGETVTVLQAQAPVAGAAAVAAGRVFFGSGLSYYDNGAQPGAFYAFGLADGQGGGGGAGGTGGGPDDNDVWVPGSPTWTAVFHDIITGTGCNGGPLCHGGNVGELPMMTRAATYDVLVGVAAMGTNLADATNPNCVDTGLGRVVPGDPDASLLVQKLDPPGGVVPCGAAMPPTGTLLTTAQIDQVRAWIAAGALND